MPEEMIVLAERKVQFPVPLQRTFSVRIHRAAPAEGGAPVDLRSLIGKGTRYEATFSTEETGAQYYWELGWISERLVHTKAAVMLDRLTKTGALLWNHNDDDQVGRNEDPYVDEASKSLKGFTRFSRTQRGQDFELDSVDEIKVTMSVRYMVHEMVLVRRGDQEKGELDEYDITSWEPLEVSMVAIPFDVNAGLGRKKAEELLLSRAKRGDQPFSVTVKGDEPVTEERSAMEPNVTPAAGGAAVATPSIEVGIAARNKEVQEIFEMCEREGQAALFPTLMHGTADVAARKLLDAKRTAGAAQTPAGLDLTSAEEKEYSFARAIVSAFDLKENRRASSFEMDISQEIEKMVPAGYERKANSILVPMRFHGRQAPKSYEEALAHARGRGDKRRTLTAGTTNAGKETVFTEPGDFIDALIAESVCVQMGATVFPDLHGNVSMPRQTSDPTMEWIGENPGTSGSESSPATDQVTFSPKTLRGRSHFTLQFLRQSTIAAENFVRSRLARSGGKTIDKAGLVGTGASNQPTGIYSQTGVLTVNADPAAGTANTVPTYLKLLAMEGAVGDANAAMGALGLVTTPLMRTTLRGTLEFPAAPGGRAIWQGGQKGGEVMGYPAMASGQMPKNLGSGTDDHGVIFGNWNELAFGYWGVMELLVDPYSLGEQGLIRVIFFQLVDVQLFHGPSFCKMTNAIA